MRHGRGAPDCQDRAASIANKGVGIARPRREESLGACGARSLQHHRTPRYWGYTGVAPTATAIEAETNDEKCHWRSLLTALSQTHTIGSATGYALQSRRWTVRLQTKGRS